MLFIEQSECVACGFCAKIRPDFFALDEHGYAFVKKSPKVLDEELERLMKKCPASCILWEKP